MQKGKGRKSLTYQRQNKLPATIFSNNWKDLLPIDELMTSTCTKDLDQNISINTSSKYIKNTSSVWKYFLIPTIWYHAFLNYHILGSNYFHGTLGIIFYLYGIHDGPNWYKLFFKHISFGFCFKSSPLWTNW